MQLSAAAEAEPPARPALLVDHQGRVWQAAPTGLWLTRENQKTLFTTRNGLPNDTITALAESLSGQVWIGTRNGLLVYDDAGFRELGYTDGLPSKQINYLYQGSQGPLWIATPEGALTYADHRLQAVEALRTTAVQGIGEATDYWVFVTGRGVVRIPKERSGDGKWWGLLGGVLAVATAGVVLARRGRKSWRAYQLPAQLAQAEQRALLAQMNPHFVFNSLNSIQKYILRNQGEAAQTYLAKFGGLMRTILEQSRHPTLPLSREVQMLRDYLELEAMRFENQFDYELTVTPEALLSRDIPVMLIHPFVENAVWHGLTHKTGKGHITIHFGQDGPYLVATVQDNGIGRQRAAQRASLHHGHPSRGMQIVEERITLLNRQLSHPIRIEVVDLETAATPAEGTRVVIRIPLQDL
ncbi:sensor histidine kinase [Hymenobacter terrenus]|uniref:sensor histidine kinase n=1 Tax=Hymenobacter terrenus TaxID=1629124 RepID=UPI0006199E3B|nr:histidine kinase [Hymenobacter terrenus]